NSGVTMRAWPRNWLSKTSRTAEFMLAKPDSVVLVRLQDCRPKDFALPNPTSSYGIAVEFSLDQRWSCSRSWCQSHSRPFSKAQVVLIGALLLPLTAPRFETRSGRCRPSGI